MQSCFGGLLTIMRNELEVYGFTCLMLFILSSVYHSNTLKSVKAGYDIGNHLFNTLPMFTILDLLEQVRLLFKVEPSQHVMSATRIPPDVKVNNQLKEVHCSLVYVKDVYHQVTVNIVYSVCLGIEASNLQSNQLNQLHQRAALTS